MLCVRHAGASPQIRCFSGRDVRRALRAASVLLLFFLAGTAQAREDVDALIRALDATREAQGVAGLAITLVERDKVLWAGGLGITDVGGRRPVTHETLFRIGSVTKLFTALAMLQLEEEGRLRLTDRLRQHIPDVQLRNDWEATHPVTLAMLLEHSAGLQDLTADEFDNSDPTPLTLEQGIAFRQHARVARWRPGLHASYSNAGYGLAGLVIERVTRQPYEAIIQSRLFDPLGMAASGFFSTETTRARLATGYAPDGQNPLPYWHMIMRPFGGIHTSARDMAPFLRMLLNQGRHRDLAIVSPVSLRRAQAPATTLAARAGLTFGYGLGLRAHYRNGVLMHGHSGDADGYLSFLGYSDALGIAYFISINRFQWPALRALRRVVENWITLGHGATPAPPAPVPAEVLRQYVGRYEPATRRFGAAMPGDRAPEGIEVVMMEGELFTLTAAGERQRLIAVDDRRFRREDEPGATAVFARDAGGRLYFEDDDAYLRVTTP